MSPTAIAEPEPDSEFVPFTKNERVQQLSAIDKSIVSLIRSAGLALQTLTSVKESSEASTLDQRNAFESSANTYFQSLQKVDIGLRRQILGLEEAGIVSAGKTKEVQDQSSAGKLAGVEKSFEGAPPKIDVGYLNSRSGTVGRDMEAELWKKSREFLESLRRHEDGRETGGIEGSDEVMGGT